MLDETHDPALRSWVTSANDEGTDFPIQNLPFGRFRRAGGREDWGVGVAIGDQVLDLRAARLLEDDDLKPLMAAEPARRRELRLALSRALREGSPSRKEFETCLVPQSQVELTLPCEIGDYTDFYTGIHHATSVGKLFRPDNPLLPNYEWVPIGYHGRSSSIVASGQPIRRPMGQTRSAADGAPAFGPCARLDYEVELGFFIAKGNAMGRPISIDDAENHLFGVTLFNDWSARDIQAWEYQPLGPFLSKNFASTMSPWVVTMEALAPFRAPLLRPAGHPDPLPYLDSKATRESGALDIRLETWLRTKDMKEAVRLSSSSAAEAAFWTPAQLVAHHTSGGCNLRPGDLFGSGTLSGPKHDQAGSLLELTRGGKEPIQLPSGEKRSFLADGDTLTLRGYCEAPDARRIGFGDCSGVIVPSASTAF